MLCLQPWCMTPTPRPSSISFAVHTNTFADASRLDPVWQFCRFGIPASILIWWCMFVLLYIWNGFNHSLSYWCFHFLLSISLLHLLCLPFPFSPSFLVQPSLTSEYLVDHREGGDLENQSKFGEWFYSFPTHTHTYMRSYMYEVSRCLFNDLNSQPTFKIV